MPFAEKAGVVTTFRAESTFGTLATNDSTAKVFRANTGAGLALAKDTIAVREVRADQQKVRDRHGFRSVTGDLAADLSLSSFDALIASAFRASYSTVLTSASFTAGYVASTGVLTRGTGSFVGEGFKVGDTFTLAGANVTAQAGIPLIIATVGTTTLTVANKDAITDISSAASTTAVRPKKLIMPASPVRTSYSVEHWTPATTSSHRFVGCRVNSIGFNLTPGEPVGATFGMVGANMLAPATSQYFTSATTDTTLPLVGVDATIAYNGSPILTLTQAQIGWSLGMAGQPVVGTTVTPDVFGGVVQPTVTISAIVDGDSFVTQFVNETSGLHAQFVCKEPGVAGWSAIGIPSFTVGSYSVDRIDASGAQILTATLLVGVATESNRDASMFSFITSAT